MSTQPTLPKIMGILNVTPDSFSDGGRFNVLGKALQQADKLIAEGADILDIGGESTRPYSSSVALEEELRRTIGVIRKLRKKHSVPISIDTTKAEVARQALEAGANIINDISALEQDEAMLDVAQQTDCPIIIMHMQGTPGTMQDRPQYNNITDEIMAYFTKRLNWLTKNDITEERITIDPGIGFGKTVEHNLAIIRHLDTFKTLGRPVLLGHSRKSFLGDVTKLKATNRDLPTAVVSALSLKSGVDILRVHNVAATKQALQVAAALL